MKKIDIMYVAYLSEIMTKMILSIMKKYDWFLISTDVDEISKTDLFQLAKESKMTEIREFVTKLDDMISFYYPTMKKGEELDDEKLMPEIQLSRIRKLERITKNIKKNEI